MARILFLVYDYYLSRVLESTWTLFRRIMHRWVRDSEKKKSVQAKRNVGKPIANGGTASAANTQEQEADGKIRNVNT